MVNLIIVKQGNYYHIGIDTLSRFYTLAIANTKVKALKLLTKIYQVFN